MDGDKGKLKEKNGERREKRWIYHICHLDLTLLSTGNERESCGKTVVNDFHELNTFSNRVLNLPAYLTLFPPLCDLVTCEELMAVPPEAVGAVQCVCVHCGGY